MSAYTYTYSILFLPSKQNPSVFFLPLKQLSLLVNFFNLFPNGLAISYSDFWCCLFVSLLMLLVFLSFFSFTEVVLSFAFLQNSYYYIFNRFLSKLFGYYNSSFDSGRAIYNLRSNPNRHHFISHFPGRGSINQFITNSIILFTIDVCLHDGLI